MKTDAKLYYTINNVYNLSSRHIFTMQRSYKAQHPGAEPEQILVALFTQIAKKEKIPIKNNNLYIYINLCIKNINFKFLKKENINFINEETKKLISNYKSLSEEEQRREMRLNRELELLSMDEWEEVFEHTLPEKKSEALRLILKNKQSPQISTLKAQLRKAKQSNAEATRLAVSEAVAKEKAKLREQSEKHKDELKKATATKNEALKELRSKYALKMQELRKTKQALEKQDRLKQVSLKAYLEKCEELWTDSKANHLKNLYGYMLIYYKDHAKTEKELKALLGYCYTKLEHRTPKQSEYLLNSFYIKLGSPPKEKLALPLCHAIINMIGSNYKSLIAVQRTNAELLKPKEELKPLSFAQQDKKAKEEELARVLENTRKKYSKSNLEGEIYELR